MDPNPLDNPIPSEPRSFGGGNPEPPDYDRFGNDGPRDPGSPPEGGPSWEYRDELGFVSAAVKTVQEVLFRPSETFAHARRAGGLGNPLLFYLLLGLIFGVIVQLENMMFGMAWMSFLMQYMPDAAAMNQQQFFLMGAHTVGGFFIRLVIMPIFLIAGLFIVSLIYHVVLMIVGGAEHGFEATFRVCSYSHGSVAVLQIIPFCGPLIGVVWSLVVLIIGLTQIHRNDTWKSVLAVLTPFLIGCCCISLFVLFGGTAFFAAMSSHP